MELLLLCASDRRGKVTSGNRLSLGAMPVLYVHKAGLISKTKGHLLLNWDSNDLPAFGFLAPVGRSGLRLFYYLPVAVPTGTANPPG